MRNILITVMMIVVVIVMFNTIIAKDTTGTKAQIMTQGATTNTQIGAMTP
ncbi:hypothetical protein [Paenibacillus xylaniclasticus]|nr:MULTISPECIES: hypothetical protein [Paenibacillus]GFN29757.1 hypothetical protein PCURB6_00170 [Paenibacillus curdlanolyticus]